MFYMQKIAKPVLFGVALLFMQDLCAIEMVPFVASKRQRLECGVPQKKRAKLLYVPEDVKSIILEQLLDVQGPTEMHQLVAATDAIKKFRMIAPAFKKLVDTPEKHAEIIEKLRRKYAYGDPLAVAILLGTPLAGSWVKTYSIGEIQKRLFDAARDGQSKIFNFLITNAPSLSRLALDTLFLRACASNSSSATIRTLISKGADVNAPSSENGTTALHNASSHGNLTMVKELIKANAQVDKQDEDVGKTALMYATLSGHCEVMQELIGAGANINYKVGENITPLRCAVHQGQEKAAELLIKAGAMMDMSNLLHTAVVDNQPHLIPILIDAGAKIDESDEVGATPLMLAAEKGDLALVELLLAYGPSLVKEDIKGCNALAYASSSDAPSKKEIKKILKKFTQ